MEEILRMEGKVALVTGTSRGTGRAISRTIARAGDRVVLVRRKEDFLARLRDEIEEGGGEAFYLVANVADQEAMEKVFQWVGEELKGKLSVRIPLARFGKPEEVAHAAPFMVSPSASYMRGHCLVVDGGWTAW